MSFFDFLAWALDNFWRFMGVWILLYVTFTGLAAIVSATFAGVAGIVQAFRG